MALTLLTTQIIASHTILDIAVYYEVKFFICEAIVLCENTIYLINQIFTLCRIIFHILNIARCVPSRAQFSSVFQTFTYLFCNFAKVALK